MIQVIEGSFYYSYLTPEGEKDLEIEYAGYKGTTLAMGDDPDALDITACIDPESNEDMWDKINEANRAFIYARARDHFASRASYWH